MSDEVYDGAIGIDLGEFCRHSICPNKKKKLTLAKGTTYSCVANYDGTNVEISSFSDLYILSNVSVKMEILTKLSRQ